MSIIEQVTRDCPREDCRIEHHGGTMTCMAWSPTYDKRGNQTGHDPNMHTQDVRCKTCGVRWSVVTQYGETTVKVVA